MEPRENRALSVIVVCIRSTWKRGATVFEPYVTLVQCNFKHQVETTRWHSHCCNDTLVFRSVASAHSFRYRLNHASGSGLALDDTSM